MGVAPAAVSMDRRPPTHRVEDLLARGDTIAARDELDRIAACAGQDARLAHDVAQLYMRLNDAPRAARFYARAVTLDPNRAAYRYNQSTALIALGQMEEAEEALDEVIAAQPRDCDAWYNRATLRKQTPERNHVAAIERELQRPGARPQDAVPLNYALAKELEDLGEHGRSFAALARGAAARRSMLSYRVEDDESIMLGIRSTLTREWMHSATPGHEDRRPVFVVGLPRSGTTLVDRILSSHSRIDSRGESADLALSLVKAAGPSRDKAELLQRSARLDPRALGKAYCATLAAHAGERVVDKTPANFLYLGLVAAALPQARIVHLRRNPMDACYAMYKTLFRMAYPFSYDLGDLARYWLAYDALMAHWREALPPGRMLEIDYEELVTDQEAVSRKLIAHTGLDWEDACLHFERNPGASLTASAAQVRQPMYRSSIGLWRKYERELAPLAARLRVAGIDIDGGDARNPAA